jgi:hypothetical protein
MRLLQSHPVLPGETSDEPVLPGEIVTASDFSKPRFGFEENSI